MLVQHTTYSPKISKMFPKETSYRVTMIRNPVSTFKYLRQECIFTPKNQMFSAKNIFGIFGNVFGILTKFWSICFNPIF